MNYCKNCGHAEVVHRLFNSRDRIIDEEPCTILGCECKNYDPIKEDEK